jgi:2-keto-4-pentenoate hydratase/2-oxohepta-3-ene-1,7-dioic acid hydratase in catechol pathway
MKLCFFDDYKLGVVKGDNVVDISSLVQDLGSKPQDRINGLIENFSSYRSKIDAAAAGSAGEPLAGVKIRAPSPKPTRVVCMAVNYNDGMATSRGADAFMKSPDAIIGDGDTMVLGDIPASVFEGEAELGVVIGKRGKNVSKGDAMSYVFGYTNFIDGSARGVVPPTNVFYQMKSRDSFAPIGPYIVTADEIKDVNKMAIRLTNNGAVMQSFNTDDMAHNIPRCIEWVTSIHTLLPGDILATGTNHRGLNPFMDGDKIELTCEGCGTLHIKVKDAHKRTWARITRLKHKESGGPGAHTPQTGGKYAPAAK